MYVSLNDAWTLLHGMVFGALFLLCFTGVMVALYGLRSELLTAEGIKARIKTLKLGTWTMAVIAWITVVIGTYIPYVPYRATGKQSAKNILLANPQTAGWHNFGMEWKEHVAWLAPILATAVAYLISYYGPRLAKETKVRKIATVLFVLAFLAAAVAGVFGALITKASPVK